MRRGSCGINYKYQELFQLKNLFSNIYRNKKVFITGHTGFKGSWLSLWLSELGAELLGYALQPDTTPNHFSLIKPDIETIIGDIRDYDKLQKTFARFKPEIVFHLAAQPIVRLSYKLPIETYETNVMGTVHVLEACRKIDSVRAIVNITSDKCYKNQEWVWGYRENDQIGGYDPYSASKGCAEIVSDSYLYSFFHPKDYGIRHHILLASARAGNVIGGGDWAEDRLVPDIMRAVSKNEEVIIRNPGAVRPWQHVLDPLSAYLLLGQRLLEGKKEFTGAWNFGPSEEKIFSVLEVAEHIKKIWNRITYKSESDISDLHESNMLKLDCSKAHVKLKWRSIWNSPTAFTKTAEWYMKYYENDQVVTESNLRDYIDDAADAGVIWSE